MSTLQVPVPTTDFRRRSLSGDREWTFRRKKTVISQNQFGISVLTSRLLVRNFMVVFLVSLLALTYLSVYLNLRHPATLINENRGEEFDMCAMTAKSINIYKDLKQTFTTGRIRVLSHYHLNEYLWKEHLLHSFDLTVRYNSSFENVSYPLAEDMRLVLKGHKEGNPAYKEIINEYPYSFIVTPSGQCGGIPIANSEGSVDILFLIKTTASHFRKRNAIRHTWANNTYTDGYTVKRIFLIGQINANEHIPLDLRSEAALYGDILIMNFTDSTRNSTWKTRGGLKWAVDNCCNATYVMLVDDNYYVATDLILQMLEFTGRLNNLYMGLVNPQTSAFRSKSNKRYISKEEFPYPVYPVSVSSSAVLMSMDFVIDVNIASMYTKHFMFDDVFLGIVASKLKISPVHNKLFYRGNIPYTNRLFRTTLACYGYDTPSGLYNAWMLHVLVTCYGQNVVNHFLMKTGNKRSSMTIYL